MIRNRSGKSPVPNVGSVSIQPRCRKKKRLSSTTRICVRQPRPERRQVAHSCQARSSVPRHVQAPEGHPPGSSQIDGPLAAADHPLHPSLGPAVFPTEHGLGQFERLLDANTTVAESAALGPEQRPCVGVVQIDRILVREHELDTPERIAVARRLANIGDPGSFDHFVAVIREVIGIGRELGQHLLFHDRQRHSQRQRSMLARISSSSRRGLPPDKAAMVRIVKTPEAGRWWARWKPATAAATWVS